MIYKGHYDTMFVGLLSSDGALHIAELDHTNEFGGLTVPPDGSREVRLSPVKAKRLVAELEAVDAEGYGDDEMNTVRHFLLARAHAQAMAS